MPQSAKALISRTARVFVLAAFGSLVRDHQVELCCIRCYLNQRYEVLALDTCYVSSPRPNANSKLLYATITAP